MKLNWKPTGRLITLFTLCGSAVAAHAQLAGMAPAQQPAAEAQPAAPQTPQEKTADGKIIVPGVDDIPAHTYVIKKKPSELFNSREDILGLASEVKANLLSDFSKYEIKDARNRMNLYGVLATVAIVEGDLDTAQKYYDTMRDLDDNPGTKPLTGQYLMSSATTAKLANGDATKHAELFEKDIKSRLEALPWKDIKPELEKVQSRATILNMNYIERTLTGGFDPYFELDHGKVGKEVVYGLLGMRASADNMVPVVHLVPKVIGEMITEHTIVYPDTWTPNQVNLDSMSSASPVTVAVWSDGGIDEDSLHGALWTNPSEQTNGLDDDNNGFIDDIHGIAYDLDATPDKTQLLSLIEMKCEPSLVEGNYIGAFEYGAALRTQAAIAYAQTTRWIATEQQKPLLEDLRLLREHRMGTFGASVAIDGNPFAKVLGVRMTNDHLDVARVTFKDDWVARRCKSITDSALYLKNASARVVVVQSLLSKGALDADLANHGYKDPKTRKQRVDLIYDTISAAFDKAVLSAPEVIFVTPAPFAQTPIDLNGFLPASRKLPNLLVVGAMGNSGEHCPFTTKSDEVWCFVSTTNITAKGSDNNVVTTSGPTLTAAVAANTIAKALAVRPQLTVADLMSAIRTNATPCPELPGKFMINPKATIQTLQAN